MTKPYGTLCTISPFVLENGAPDVEEGHYLRTDAGSVYLVVQVHRIKGNRQRLRLACQRTDPEELNNLPNKPVIVPMYWASRDLVETRPLPSGWAGVKALSLQD